MNVREIKATIAQYNLGISSRRMGQHFLVDLRALTRIVGSLEIGPEDPVLEIGAGLGALTEHLLATGAQVAAVERDARFLKVLTDRFKSVDHLQLVRSDILKMELSPYAAGREKSLVVFGNIPYSMTSAILQYLVEQRRWVKRAVLTMQKEVAQRIVAKPCTKAYSSLTLLVGVAFKPKIAFNIPPGAFYPQPKVTSSVLRLDPLEEPVVAPEQEAQVLRLVRQIFTHRRKTLVNALLTAGRGLERAEAMAALEAAGISPTCRPETLGLQEVASLLQALPESSEPR